jgi:hypothetical protein
VSRPESVRTPASGSLACVPQGVGVGVGVGDGVDGGALAVELPPGGGSARTARSAVRTRSSYSRASLRAPETTPLPSEGHTPSGPSTAPVAAPGAPGTSDDA